MPLAKCSFGMIPQHATQLIDHHGRSTPLPTIWYEHLVLRCYVFVLSQESCFWMEARAWQGVGHGVGVSGHRLVCKDKGLCLCLLFSTTVIQRQYHCPNDHVIASGGTSKGRYSATEEAPSDIVILYKSRTDSD